MINEPKKDIVIRELIRISYEGGKKHQQDVIASGILLETRRI